MSEPLVVELEDEEGLVFWPAYCIASLVPEYGERWRAVDGRGRLAYRPTPPPEGPWVRLGKALVLPHLLVRNERGIWCDPAGFELGVGELLQVPLPGLRPALKGMPCSPDQVIRLESAGGGGHCQWVTEVGTFLCRRRLGLVAKKMPELVRIVRDLWLPRFRLRRLQIRQPISPLELDDGTCLQLAFKSGVRVCQRLGLSDPYHLLPHQAALWRDGKRDYPYELARLKGSRLRELFQTPRQLIAHLVWQAYRLREQGVDTEYGDNHRAFWYIPLAPTLYRAGFMTREELDERLPEDDKDASELYQDYITVLARMVGEDRLFTYTQLGFVEVSSATRGIGETRPELVLLIEKESMARTGQQLADEFGISWVVMGGHVTWIASEYLAGALERVGVTCARVIALTDWDPMGWWIGQTLPRNLQRFGIASERAVDYLVTPECFSAEEIALYAQPCSMASPAVETTALNWVAATGGIGGKPMGIHADHLPYDRLLGRLRQVLEC